MMSNIFDTDVAYFDTVRHFPSFLDNYLCQDIIKLVKKYLRARTVQKYRLRNFNQAFKSAEDERYKYRIFQQIPNYYIHPKYAKGFYKNIAVVFYLTYEMNWDSWWNLIGKLHNGKYFYYYASCTHTGFTACGRMVLYLSDTLENLVNYGLDKEIRIEFIKFQLKGYKEEEERVGRRRGTNFSILKIDYDSNDENISSYISDSEDNISDNDMMMGIY